MARNIERVMRLILDAEQLTPTLMRDAEMLLHGLSVAEKVNVMHMAVRGRREQGDAGSPSETPED